MRISVALATWNGERFLPQQLNSLVAQTCHPFEVVISDDGSTDRTHTILEDFRAAAPFDVIIKANPTRLGYAENFLRAATMCSGDFIAFCDQDDVWVPSKLARCSALLSTSGAVLLIHRNLVVTEDLVPTLRRVPSFRRSVTAAPLRVQPWLLAPGNAMVCSREVFSVDPARRPRGLNRDGAQMTHDEWTYFIATATGSTHFSSEVLVYYRQHGANVFGAPDRSTLRPTIAPSDYRFLAERARERCRFFDERATSGSSECYRRAAAYYRALAARLDARADVYSDQDGTGQRVRAFARLVAAGGYRPRTRGGLGLRSFLKDAVGLVAFTASTRSPRRAR